MGKHSDLNTYTQLETGLEASTAHMKQLSAKLEKVGAHHNIILTPKQISFIYATTMNILHNI
jgi:hypothetical protein